MYINDFFDSLTLLQSSYQFIDEDFFQDKQYIQTLTQDQLSGDILYQQKAQYYLIYKQEFSDQLYAYGLDDLYHYIDELFHFQITVPISQAIYLEAAVLEALYLYDHLFYKHFHNSLTHLLLPLPYLYNLFCGQIEKNQKAYPKTYMIPILQQLFMSRFYYFLIQYCYIRFQCQQHHSLTHPYHFDLLVQNKLTQYLKSKPIQHITDLTFLENIILDEYIQSLQNDS
ncbi:hypothetical protein NMU03_00590 [Allocoprobacillus halotolerans]|uniref:Uncharacterized protein n=1 Tax=Allocoprobacillus halotolerans TaxID=2944914 RepID=A0ABY5I2T5_9FIRM|nr:hypothetical protein [Allocoprobacillus halotolerans]UTY39365.1 hypothetical protein NMU03_00590 [Allocoprobacillus halotolerans]